MRRDGSTYDLEAEQEAARDSGPTRRIVNADGSVTQLASEGTGDGTKAVVETARLRAVEETERELAADLAAYEAEREELIAATADDEYLLAQLAEDEAKADLIADAAEAVEVIGDDELEAAAKDDRDRDATTATPIVNADADPSRVRQGEGFASDPFDGSIIVEQPGVSATAPSDAPFEIEITGGYIDPHDDGPDPYGHDPYA